ncbi:MAG: RNA-binding protein [Coprococcus sp.]|nr:RNA-binding protein [Coprococcus sp.]
MEKDEILFRKRLIELSDHAYHRGTVSFTDFLNLNELNILHTTPKEMFAVPYRTFGGYALSERQMAAFLPDAFSLYQEEEEILSSYPIEAVKIIPLNEKFADNLSHRDYLGALLHLGVDRSKLGDILIQDKEATVFVCKHMAEFLTEELTRVRHTIVQVKKTDIRDFHYEPKIEEIKGTVASVRIDALLSLAYSTSRSKLIPLIEGGRVYVNGKLITGNGYRVKEDDIVSVRGMGRFQYKGVLSETKKGRCFVSLYKYI